DEGVDLPPERDRVRALSAGDYSKLVDFLRMPVPERKGPGRPGVQRRDVADLILFMLGTGCRISEALAVRWGDVDLDSDEPTVRFCATLVRRSGKGLLRQEHTKSAQGMRTVSIPAETAELLADRRKRDEQYGGTTPNRVGVVFPSASGTYWDRSNCTKRIRAILDDDSLGLSWATSHSFRKTFVSDLLDAGVPVRAVASTVGHRRISTTERHYVDTESTAHGTGEQLAKHRAERKVANKVAKTDHRPSLRIVS
ncbi:MAG: site-specific integrase, partial [Brachybacterium sp.]|nr:site-specific integrase [Brachybacterium sp.]